MARTQEQRNTAWHGMARPSRAWQMQAVKAFMPGWLLFCLVCTSEWGRGQRLSCWHVFLIPLLGIPVVLLERREITRELTEGALATCSYIHVRKATWSAAVVPLHGLRWGRGPIRRVDGVRDRLDSRLSRSGLFFCLLLGPTAPLGSTVSGL